VTKAKAYSLIQRGEIFTIFDMFKGDYQLAQRKYSEVSCGNGKELQLYSGRPKKERRVVLLMKLLRYTPGRKKEKTVTIHFRK